MGKKKAKNRSKKSNFETVTKSRGNKHLKKSSTQGDDGGAGPIRGLNNIGNTCFFNSCLQAINSVIAYEDIASEESSCAAGKVYANLLITLQCLQTAHSRSSYNPGMLLNEIAKHAPQFKNRRQQDSHELFITLMSVISDEVVENRAQHTDTEYNSTGKLAISSHYQDDPILSLFSGKYGSIVTCLHCSSRSCSLQDCLDISLQIPGSKHLMGIPRLHSSSKTQQDKKKKKINDVCQVESCGSTYAALDDDVNNVNDDMSPSSSSNIGSDIGDDETCQILADVLEELVLLVATADADASNLSQQIDEQSDINVRMLEPEPEKEKSIDILEPTIGLVDQERKDRGGLSVYSLLDDFTSPEELLLSDGNGYLCANCNGSTSSSINHVYDSDSVRRDAKKRLVLVSAPLVLVLHLKRLLPGGKCSKYVSFPLVLSLKDYIGTVTNKSGKGNVGGHGMAFAAAESNKNINNGYAEVLSEKIDKVTDVETEEDHEAASVKELPRERQEQEGREQEQTYVLHAVVVHQGGALGGHYVAYVRARDAWYFTSDTSTRAVTEAEVLKTEAYMLFYKQVGKETNKLDDDGGAVDRCSSVVDEEREDAMEKERDENNEQDKGMFSMPNDLTGTLVSKHTSPESTDKSNAVDLRWAKSLKTAELKKELQSRNLSIQGSKKELLLRLWTHPTG